MSACNRLQRTCSGPGQCLELLLPSSSGVRNCYRLEVETAEYLGVGKSPRVGGGKEDGSELSWVTGQTEGGVAGKPKKAGGGGARLSLSARVFRALETRLHGGCPWLQLDRFRNTNPNRPLFPVDCPSIPSIRPLACTCTLCLPALAARPSVSRRRGRRPQLDSASDPNPLSGLHFPGVLPRHPGFPTTPT